MEYLDDDIYEQIDVKNMYSNLEDYDKMDGKRVIGMYTCTQDHLLFGSCVDSKTFFQHINNSHIFRYLIENMTDASWFNRQTPISIMQVQYKNDVLNVVDKTIWIRLIQRHWRSKWATYKTQLLTGYNQLYRRELGINVHCYSNPIRGLLNRYSNSSAIA